MEDGNRTVIQGSEVLETHPTFHAQLVNPTETSCKLFKEKKGLK
jgi:hypothetical protein